MNCYCFSSKGNPRDCCICRELERHCIAMLQIYNNIDDENKEGYTYRQWYNMHYVNLPRRLKDNINKIDRWYPGKKDQDI